MTIETTHPLSRRNFCRAAGLGAAGLILSQMSCTGGQRVLKYPESADEIADFWAIYAEPGFNAEAAISGLHITGEPEKLEQPPDGVWVTYPKQNDLVREVRLALHKDLLEEIYIYYVKPIDISFRRLESLFGRSRNYGGPVGKISAPGPMALLSNIDPSKPRPSGPYYSGFGFEATHKRSDGSTVDGLITVSADDTSTSIVWGTKKVDWMRFSKFEARS